MPDSGLQFFREVENQIAALFELDTNEMSRRKEIWLLILVAVVLPSLGLGFWILPDWEGGKIDEARRRLLYEEDFEGTLRALEGVADPRAHDLRRMAQERILLNEVAELEKSLPLAARPQDLPGPLALALATHYDQLRKLKPENSEYEEQYLRYRSPAETYATKLKDLAAELEIVRWRWYQEGDFVRIEGQARNVGSRTLDYVEVVIRFLSLRGDIVLTERDYLDVESLRPGSTATFGGLFRWRPLMEVAELSFSRQGAAVTARGEARKYEGKYVEGYD